ncbi:MAG: hypothetical protein AB7F66_09190 [Bacteriovoracia bacterium]
MITNPLKTENQWKELNRTLNFYKLLALISGSAALLCLIMTIGGAFSNPIVVMKNETEHCFVKANKEAIDITDNDVTEFVRDWVVTRYEWETLNEEKLIRSLSPFTSEGLLQKIREQFRSGAEKEFKEKQVSQYVSKSIRVKLADKQVLVNFDRILRVNNIPLIDPAQMSFTLVRGTKSKVNPQGIYVNGITEHKSN